MPTAKGDARVSKLVHEGEARRTVGEILADSGRDDPVDRAAGYLRSALADGPRATVDVEEDARKAGISQRTLKRARSNLRIPAAKRSDGSWWMSLPEHEGDLREEPDSPPPAKSAKGATVPYTGTLGTLDPLDVKRVKGATVPTHRPSGTLGTLDAPDDDPEPPF